MPSSRLLHHLRKYRKTSGLAQHELAFLLGCRSGAKVSRYEHFSRVPLLRTAIALEVIFGTPLRSLLPGLYENARTQVSHRAEQLVARLSKNPSTRRNDTIALLKSLVEAPADVS